MPRGLCASDDDCVFMYAAHIQSGGGSSGGQGGEKFPLFLFQVVRFARGITDVRVTSLLCFTAVGGDRVAAKHSFYTCKGGTVASYHC